MRITCSLLLTAMLVACAQTDPYKRLETAPTADLTLLQAAEAFNSRWPRHFKCVQTVTIDFRVETRTLVGYLVVQQPGRFRLQGMTEQGLKLFDVAYDYGKTTRVFAADEFDSKVIDNIVRDICRTFLESYGAESEDADPPVNVNQTVSVTKRDGGTRVEFWGRQWDIVANLVGDPARVDWHAGRQSGRDLYRVDQYEWKDFAGQFLPSVIVLREPGVQSDGPPYKLTIKVTELTVRDKPWPEKMFNPEKDD
jgi:hypothetical protein